MISNLTIKNYALIDTVDVAFNPGLTIITGETGAGKSILLGALSLLLGKRADLGAIKDKSRKSIIEATFNLAGYKLEELFETNDLDYEDVTIVRREILPGGKSRAFINDTPVMLSQLQGLGPYLVDIHSQHETISLFSENFQMEVIDVLADNKELLSIYTEHRIAVIELNDELEELTRTKQEAVKELDYNSFLYNELKEAKLEGVDQKQLEEQYETLNHSEEIQESLGKIVRLLSDDSVGSLTTLREARIALSQIQSYASVYADLWERLNSALIELEDIQQELYKLNNEVDSDPELLFQLQSKLQNIYKLQQKHTVATVEELVGIQNELESKIFDTEGLDERIEQLVKKQDAHKEVALETAKKIRERRDKAIPQLKEKLEGLLQNLGLPNARFKFELTGSDVLRTNGMDELTLLFTANKGLPFGPLKKIVSGGELSRIMLAVKAVLAEYKLLPTIIFDEIDTGVSGEIANKMAGTLSNMGSKMQLISITHHPQIAAKGDWHFKVFKEDRSEVTSTLLKVLDSEERIVEIASMIAGEKVTDAAIANARELLN